VITINEYGIVKNFLKDEEFFEIQNYFLQHKSIATMTTDEFGRKLLGDRTESILKDFSEKVLPKAKRFFKSDTMLSSYSLFAEYSDSNISLSKHTDANACTYTVDLVLYQKSPWGLWVNGTEFLANPNDAVMFMGEKYEHWRDPKYDNNDRIGVVFFHYVEPDHWWFTEGPDYVEKIRAQKASQTNY
jgi:hypothetical protein